MSRAMFRHEALAHHAQETSYGDVLRLDRRWTRAAHGLLIMAALAGFMFVSLVGVDEYASGPAVVRIEGRHLITATGPATVEAVQTAPGHPVKPGTVLVQMHNDDEVHELARAQHELDLQVVRLLRDPNDTSVRSSMVALRSGRDQAKLAVEARTLRAPVPGYVSDVRVRPGQHVEPGEVIATILPEGAAETSLLALVPAEYRPMLKSGLSVRFALDGFQYEYSDLKLAEVSAEAVGPTETLRFLGREHADAVALPPGAKVLVTARLPAATFASEGNAYKYFDGLTGTVEIRVRREPILVTLVPALRQLLSNSSSGSSTVMASVHAFTVTLYRGARVALGGR